MAIRIQMYISMDMFSYVKLYELVLEMQRGPV